MLHCSLLWTSCVRFLTKSPAIPQQLYKTASRSLSAIVAQFVSDSWASCKNKRRPSANFNFWNFHFWSRDVYPVQNVLLCTKFHENPIIFYLNMATYRFSKWRPSAILELFYHYTRPPTKSLLLATAACQISCQSDKQIWRYSYLIFFAYLAWNAYSGPQNDFSPLNVIIHHLCVNSRLLIYQQCKNPLRGLTCRRVDRKCDGHTYTHRHTDTHTGKFIFCPCIALDRQ